MIHAATMVTAGVYMLARCMPLYSRVADCFARGDDYRRRYTALLGAIIAITQTDLKRILAYSTISHIGYMFLAMGTGTLIGVTAGMFHLVTHAFFKALLFLAAGSVMHAMGGVIDIRSFGGLRHRMPVTHWTFLFGGPGIGRHVSLRRILEQGRHPAGRGRKIASGTDRSGLRRFFSGPHCWESCSWIFTPSGLSLSSFYGKEKIARGGRRRTPTNRPSR